MKAATFHLAVADSSNPTRYIELCVEAFSKLGYESLMRDAETILTSRLGTLGIEDIPSMFSTQSSEVMYNPSGPTAITIDWHDDEVMRVFGRINRIPTRLRANGSSAMVVVRIMSNALSDHTVSEIRNAISEASGQDVVNGTPQELVVIEALKARFGDLSPNGKLLQDPTIRTACRLMADDELRHYVTPLVSAFGQSPSSRDAIAALNVLGENPAALADILSNDKIVSAHFSAFCEECRTSQLALSQRDIAENAVRDAGHRCGSCGKEKLVVQDTYAVTDGISRAVQQGLWLESLADDALRCHSNAVWAGQMARRDELDVIGVVAEQTVLIECKDTNLGSNDVYVTAAKANNIDANLVIMVTTNDVHQNVIESINDISASSDGRRFKLISESASGDIRGAIDVEIKGLVNRSVRNWLFSAMALDYMSFNRSMYGY